MIKKKTVLILGAGASVPYFYPTMNELRRDIIYNFKNEYNKHFKTVSTMNAPKGISSGKIDGFINRFRMAGKLSINEYLSFPGNKSDEYYGLMAIAISIANYERKNFFGTALESHLLAKSQREPNYQYEDEDWYSELHKLLVRPIISGEETLDDFGKNLSVITFNYDRSLEQFLYISLIPLFPDDQVKVIKQLNNLSVVHVYGQIIPLQWQNKPRPYCDYTNIDNADQIQSCVKNIHVMHQERSTNPQIDEARQLIKEADRIFILGFGFDEYNYKLLGFPNIINPGQKIYHTERDLSADSQLMIKKLYDITEPNRGPQINNDYENIRLLIRDYLMGQDEKEDLSIAQEMGIQ